MNNKEALEFLTETWGQCYRCSKYDECHQLKEHETICENAKFIVRQALNRLEELEEILDILRHNTNISKNGKGFTISIWLNTENCDMPSCSNLEELLKVFRVLKEKKVLIDTYSKEVFEND